MKVLETIERYGEDGDSRITVLLTDDNDKKFKVSFGEGEPEDMYLYRDLSDAYGLVDFAKLAFEAGKRGESWEFEEVIQED